MYDIVVAMKKIVSTKEFFELIETRYNHCQVCGELLKKEEPDIIAISKATINDEGFISPWKFIYREKTINTEGSDFFSGKDQLLVHEKCFFSSAGEDWKF